MQNSLFLKLLLLPVFAGCVSIRPSHLEQEMTVAPDQQRLQPGITMTNSLFRATLDIKGHHLTGLLMIKRMDTVADSTRAGASMGSRQPAGKGRQDVATRIVFASEIGMTYFDLELKPGGDQVISCFGPLNKKALLNILESDFTLLTGVSPLRITKTCRQTTTRRRIYGGKAGSLKSWYTLSEEGDTLFSTAARSNMVNPVFIKYNGSLREGPSKINMDNPVIGLNMSLKLLKR